MIPDEVIAAATAKYDELINESTGFTVDVQAMLTAFQDQVVALVASKIPVEFGLTIVYSPQVGGHFNSHEPHTFLLKADNIMPITLVVRIASGNKVETELSVQGAIFVDLLPAIGFSHKLYQEMQASVSGPAPEFITLEQ